MLAGVTLDPRDYTHRALVFPESQMCRVFGYSRKGMPSWKPTTGDGRVAWLRQQLPNVVPACVFQDWSDDTAAKTRVLAWLDEVDGPCRLTWKHEADRKREDPTVLRRRYYLLQQWINDHANGHWVTLVPTQTYQWTTFTGPGKGAGDWSRYYVGIGNPGVDVYANSWEAHYPDPATFLAPLWRYRDTIRTALEIPEFGAARVKGDTTGQARADWLYQCGTMMRSEGVTAVAYWDDLGTGGTDLRLWTDTPTTPEVAAWSAVMADIGEPAVSESQAH